MRTDAFGAGVDEGMAADMKATALVCAGARAPLRSGTCQTGPDAIEAHFGVGVLAQART